jgi:tRNA A-37 threonylcarbamoyl transferase component Bud32
MTTPAPQKLGRYEVLEEVGKGAMGVVYLARDPLIGRQVALKTFRVGFSAKDQELQQFRSRFVREAQSAGILSHPNIVTIHDVVDEGGEGVCFIAMEYVKGTNLKQLLQRSDPFSHDYVVQIIAQIAEALDYAHSRGVVHRDIKPANILITPDDKVKITDFGIARLDTSNLTMEGQLLGTPNYMAPEQIQGKEVDHRADIFSLGVVFYEMLTRRKPFQGENLTAVTHKIVYEPFTPPEDLVTGLPAGLAAVLRRCLEKDPNRRYPRAAEIAAELRKSISRASADDDDTSATQEVAEQTAESTVERTVPALVAAAPPTVAMPRAPGGEVAPPGPFASPPPPGPPAGPIAAAIPAGQPSGQKQVSAALKRIRTQRVVQLGLLAIAVMSVVVIAWLWIREGGGARADATIAAESAAAARATEIATGLAEARAAVERGDLQAALRAVARVEARDPENAEARALRGEIDRVSRDLSVAAEREQRISEGLILAREEYAKRRYEQAIAAADTVLGISPENAEAGRLRADSQSALARQQDRPKPPRPPAPASPAPSMAAPSPAVAVTPRPQAVAPAPVGDATIGIEFFSEASEGVLTIYAGERQIVRESFKFVRKTGFLSREKISGNLQFERTLPAGPVALRVYVSTPGKPTKSILLEENLGGGSTAKLRIQVDADGRTTAALE